jgi:hypothetical protein
MDATAAVFAPTVPPDKLTSMASRAVTETLRINSSKTSGEFEGAHHSTVRAACLQPEENLGDASRSSRSERQLIDFCGAKAFFGP